MEPGKKNNYSKLSELIFADPIESKNIQVLLRKSMFLYSTLKKIDHFSKHTHVHARAHRHTHTYIYV